MNELYIASVAVIFALSIAAVLSSWFNDNMTQRIGLAVINIGAFGVLFSTWQHGLASETARTTMVFGIAVFGIGSAMKAIKYRARAPKHLRGHRNGQSHS